MDILNFAERCNGYIISKKLSIYTQKLSGDQYCISSDTSGFSTEIICVATCIFNINYDSSVTELIFIQRFYRGSSEAIQKPCRDLLEIKREKFISQLRSTRSLCSVMHYMIYLSLFTSEFIYYSFCMLRLLHLFSANMSIV